MPGGTTTTSTSSSASPPARSRRSTPGRSSGGPNELDVLALELVAAPLAAQVPVGGAAAVAVQQGARRPGGRGVELVAPQHQVRERLPQRAALGGQAVLVARWALLVAAALEDALVDEALEAVGEDLLGEAEAPLEVLKSADAVEGVADEQHRPSLADDLQGAGDRADLVVVRAGQHPSATLAAWVPSG